MKKYFIFFLFISCASTADFEKNMSLGDNSLQKGDLREAIDNYTQAVHLQPEDQKAHLQLGLSLFKAGDYKGSIENILQSNTLLSVSFEGNFALGESYRILKNYREALSYLKKAHSLDIKSTKALRSMTWIYLKCRKYSLAKLYAENAVKINKTDPENQIVLLRIYLKLKKLREARDILISRNWPDIYHPILYSLKGDLFASLGKYESAIKSYKKALELNPLLVSALLGLSSCYQNTGENVLAEKILKKSEHLIPKYDGLEPTTHEILNAQDY